MTTSPTSEWKLGEACFIAVVDVTPQRIRLQVMPAMVTNPRARIAQALNPSSAFGPISETGQPFRTEEEARASIKAYVERVVQASADIPLVGSPLRRRVPKDLPNYGDVVYCIVAKAKEVLEVTIGFLSIEDGPLKVGYDPSLGNPEASCIGITEWWTEPVEALQIAHERHGVLFELVSKEEVARRANKADTVSIGMPPDGWARDILPEHPAE